ncbi:MAG: carboxymuconolactone decarboxylase family protein [Desulfobacterales bacterium]|nr:carboxymuconolactone decarboxylase family protein [Desulfobacterales bacterium]
MSQPRILPVEPPYESETAHELEKIMPPGIEPLKLFRTLAHNPRILRKFRRSNLLDRGSIDRRDREIVILRTCARCGAEYEWGVHVVFFAARFGITEEQVEATVNGTAAHPCWPEKEALLIRLVDELHDVARISDDLWLALSANWQPSQLIELIVLAGFYHTVSFVINGARVELEEGTPRFPPP